MKFYVNIFLLVILMTALIGTSYAEIDAVLKQRIAERIRELETKQIEFKIASEDDQFDNYDVNYYRINIQVFPSDRTISGDVTVKASIIKDNTDQITLNFYNTLEIYEVRGNTVSHNHANNLIAINLDRSYQQGEMVEITIVYAGDPTSNTSFNPFRIEKYNNRYYISTDNEPYFARTWFPCNDSPGDKADSADIIITVPDDLFAASNGILVNTAENMDATKTYHWHEKYPIATYLISLAIANYSLIEGEYISAEGDTLPLHHYIFPEDLSKARTEFDVTADAIKYFVPYFGEYPFLDEKYGHAEYRGNWAGMENQTMTSIAHSYIRGNQSAEFLIAHELSHQWWGDWVTPAHFDHIWINEGFATYSEMIYAKEKYGEAVGEAYMNSIMNSALNQSGTIFRYGSDNIITGIVYSKGAAVLHMLRNVIGDNAFLTALKKYGADFAFRNATTEDFQLCCETEYGESLDWFFHQWIYEAGHPHYEYAWTFSKTDDNQYKIEGYIDQIQNEGPVFQMPLDITVTSAVSDTLTHTILNATDSQLFGFTSTFEPEQLLLDDNNKILNRATMKDAAPLVMYNGHQFTDSGGDGYWDAGETMSLQVAVENHGIHVDSVTLSLSTNDETIEILKGTQAYGALSHRMSLANADSPFQLMLTSNEGGYLSVVHIDIRAAGGYSASDSFVIEVGRPDILLVDDDPLQRFEDDVLPRLRDQYIFTETWSHDSGISLDSVASRFNTMIWITGNDRVTAITAEEQAVITSLFENGGHLLLSGQNIGFDLVEDGSKQDSMFYSEYMKASYIGDDANPNIITGIPGDPVSNGIYLSLRGNYGGAGNQDSPDIIAPVSSAAQILRYAPSGGCAGIRYAFPETGARLIYLPFGIEGIAGPYAHSANDFLAGCFSWLGGTTDVSESGQHSLAPSGYHLWQNYPNPFNPVTTIRYHLPANVELDLSIYNISGQLVRTLVKGRATAGDHSVVWNGRNDSGDATGSGLYLMRLRAGRYLASRKLILMK